MNALKFLRAMAAYQKTEDCEKLVSELSGIITYADAMSFLLQVGSGQGTVDGIRYQRGFKIGDVRFFEIARDPLKSPQDSIDWRKLFLASAGEDEMYRKESVVVEEYKASDPITNHLSYVHVFELGSGDYSWYDENKILIGEYKGEWTVQQTNFFEWLVKEVLKVVGILA